MPKGPRGEKRPADVIGAAVMVGRIAVGDVEDAQDQATKAARPRQSGKRGGAARSAKLTPEQRSEIARIAADARWKKS